MKHTIFEINNKSFDDLINYLENEIGARVWQEGGSNHGKFDRKIYFEACKMDYCIIWYCNQAYISDKDIQSFQFPFKYISWNDISTSHLGSNVLQFSDTIEDGLITKDIPFGSLKISFK